MEAAHAWECVENTSIVLLSFSFRVISRLQPHVDRGVPGGKLYPHPEYNKRRELGYCLDGLLKPGPRSRC